MFTITLSIIIITSIVSLTALNNPKIQEDLLFWPAEIDSRKQYYRFFSYGFIHADLIHLLFNMMALYSIGRYLEMYLFTYPHIFGDKGRLFYLALYLTAIVVSPIPDYFKHRNTFAYRALGASGAVSAVVFAGILLKPDMGLYIMFIPFAIPGYIFGVLFLALSAFLARKGGGNIGHGAHLTGAFYGLIFTIVATKLYSGFNAVQHFIDTIINRY
jgi:membrane associated rhomboid family serine protease